jgi:hypothetical protein
MKKVKIEDTLMFKQVAKVIGEKQAKIELFKASKSWDKSNIKDIEYGKDLLESFVWRKTLQGVKFWEMVHNEENPYEEQ